MMRILLCNDDGVHAYGLKVIFKELKKIGQVFVVAPIEEKSTTGHSLTIHKPLRIIPMGKNFYGVNGSPADCVYLGIREVIGSMPSLVVSGINRGGNLGQDVYYSGTVSAAREACILGIPALAVSLSLDFSKGLPENKLHYETAAKMAVKVLKNLQINPLPKHTMLNLNVPDLPIRSVKGIQLTRQGFRYYSGSVLKRKDHRGKDYFWVGGRYKGFKAEENTDCLTVAAGFASITPLKLDCTDFQFLEEMQRKWNLFK
ncbi:MAG: 5'/3'-nucleotidase SurE [Deltaproteobacteria bacterium]|nr:5'/3'-nucleotidase SurE [Deltaproteobacteria bacterium]